MRTFTAVLLLLTTAFGSAAAADSQPAPELNAEAAILIELSTKSVLFEKNADETIPPASMTKLMTIHLALNFVKAGTASLNSPVPVSRAADFRSLPPRSSLMFIEEGQKVNLLELLKGLALPSGNDAGIAVAEFLAGSVPEWVALMNHETKRLGMENTSFDDASGLSEKNMTTARDFASFCAFYIEEHPEALEMLHILTKFTYPEAHNIPEGSKSVHGPITQRNHNLLIGRMPGVDGLKTGYIDESGYNLAATAVRGGRRLILVTMGGTGYGSYDGSLKRVIDAVTLFNYGFYGWSIAEPSAPQDRRMRVFGGQEDYIDLNYEAAEAFSIKTERLGSLTFKTKLNEPAFPVKTGDILGSWLLIDGEGQIYRRGDVKAANNCGEGNFFKRLIDSIKKR